MLTFKTRIPKPAQVLLTWTWDHSRQQTHRSYTMYLLKYTKREPKRDKMNKLVHTKRDLEIFLTLVHHRNSKDPEIQIKDMKVCVQVLLQLPSDILFSHPLRCVGVVTWTWWHRVLFRMAIHICCSLVSLYVQHTQSSSGDCYPGHAKYGRKEPCGNSSFFSESEAQQCMLYSMWFISKDSEGDWGNSLILLASISHLWTSLSQRII